MQDGHSYFIKLSLTLSYSRKKNESLDLIVWIPSARLSTRFDNEHAINHALSINFNLNEIVIFSFPSLSTFVTSLSIGVEKHFVLFCIFQTCLLIFLL